VIAAIATMGFAFAAPVEERIERMLERDRTSAAQRRCLKRSADLIDADPLLRETCAQAWLSRATALDRAARWSYFRKTWKGTVAAKTALSWEASAALDLCTTPQCWLAVETDYRGTPPADEARQLRATHQRDAISTASEAAQFVADWPDHADVPTVIFAHGHDLFTVSSEPALNWSIPIAVQASVIWAAQDDSGAVVSLEEVANGILAGEGVTGRKPPNCSAPAPWTNGVQITINGETTFAPTPTPPACEADPVSIEVRDERVVSLAGHALPIDAGWFGPSDRRTPVSGNTLAPSYRGRVVWNPIDTYSLAVPLDGALPWYTPIAPSGDPLGLAAPNGSRSLPVLVVETLGLDPQPLSLDAPPDDADRKKLSRTDRSKARPRLDAFNLKPSLTKVWKLPLPTHEQPGLILAGTLDEVDVVGVILPGESGTLTIWESPIPGIVELLVEGANTWIRMNDRTLSLRNGRVYPDDKGATER